MSSILLRSLGYLLFGFVIASMITFAIYLIVDYRRWSKYYPVRWETCCWGCSPNEVWPGCALHSKN